MLSDLRFALRALVKAPGFTIAATLVLALGIGANTAVFSLVHTLLFAPPAYARPDEIVQVFSQNKKNPQSFRSFSYPTYHDIREQNTVFSGLLAYNLVMVGIGEKDDTHRSFASFVSSNYFPVLGVAPAAGRAFLPEEEVPGRNVQVVIVSHGFWKKHGLDPAFLGATILVKGRPFTVVGIMPESFTGTMQVITPEIWLPLGAYDLAADDGVVAGQLALSSRTIAPLLLLGRLKPGQTAAAALPALRTLATNLEAEFPVEQKDQTLLVAPLSRLSTSDSPADDQGPATLAALLLGMAGVVLLVACLNLANMLLARGTARRRDIAIRLALGSGRGRIVRQLLTEGFVLALLGGVAGLILALWSSDLLVASFGHALPFEIVWSTGPGLPLFGATFGFCLLGTLAFALGPALKLSRGEMIHGLKENAGEDPAVRRWKRLSRHPLVVVQIALSLALLTAAFLFIRGAIAAGSVDTGLRVDGNYLVEVDASLAGHDQTQARLLYARLRERLAALPGVESASFSTLVPFGLNNPAKGVQRAGVQSAPDARPATVAEGLAFSVRWSGVGPDYFKSVGLPLLQGRAFTTTEAEAANGPAVAIIDEVLARKLWPDGNALGQRIQNPRAAARNATALAPGSALPPPEAFEIVGIVPATRSALFEKQPKGMLYLPFARGFQRDVFFHLKFARIVPGSETATAALVRRAVHDVDAGLSVLSVKTFAQHLDSNFQLWMVRAGATLFSVFGGLALGLAVVGIYGVKAYSIARRTREIGIRMALGARPGGVQWMILREGLTMLGGGLALGILLAFATGRIVGGMLYQVSPTDPVAFMIAPALLSLAALLACWIPARRATRGDPMVALRTD